MQDRSARLQLLYAMFERNLKRELTPEERRLLALSDAYCGDDQQAEPDEGLAKSAS